MDPSPENQRTRQRLETRSQLLTLAIDEFRARGVDKARIRDIVEKAGVVPGTFYFHFPTKAHVLFELGQRLVERVAQTLPGTPGRPARLSSLLRALAAAPEMAADEIGDPELLRQTIASFQRPPIDVDFNENPIQEALRACLVQEKKRGAITNEMEADELSRIILIAFFGVLLSTPRNGSDLSNEVRRTLGFFESALIPQE
jgi:AcrR family transcriptional regulator